MSSNGTGALSIVQRNDLLAQMLKVIAKKSKQYYTSYINVKPYTYCSRDDKLTKYAIQSLCHLDFIFE